MPKLFDWATVEPQIAAVDDELVDVDPPPDEEAMAEELAPVCGPPTPRAALPPPLAPPATKLDDPVMMFVAVDGSVPCWDNDEGGPDCPPVGVAKPPTDDKDKDCPKPPDEAAAADDVPAPAPAPPPPLDNDSTLRFAAASGRGDWRRRWEETKGQCMVKYNICGQMV